MSEVGHFDNSDFSSTLLLEICRGSYFYSTFFHLRKPSKEIWTKNRVLKKSQPMTDYTRRTYGAGFVALSRRSCNNDDSKFIGWVQGPDPFSRKSDDYSWKRASKSQFTLTLQRMPIHIFYTARYIHPFRASYFCNVIDDTSVYTYLSSWTLLKKNKRRSHFIKFLREATTTLTRFHAT